MRQFALDLDRNQSRPIVLLDGVSALLDTGAVIPVWTGEDKVLERNFNTIFIKVNVSS